MKLFHGFRCIITMIVVLFFCGNNNLSAQPRSSFSDELEDAGKSFSGLWKETFSPGKTGTRNFILYSAATTGAFFLDEQVRKFASRQHSETADALFSIDKFYGDVYTYIPILALYGYGISANQKDVRELGLKLTAATTFALLYNMSLKAIVGRSRPFTEKGNSNFDPFSTAFEKTSFPSGHTTFAFSIAAVVDYETNSLPLEVLFYTAASITAMARIYHDVHWFSDTVAGAAIGYFAGRWVAAELDRLNEKRTVPEPFPSPVIFISIPL